MILFSNGASSSVGRARLGSIAFEEIATSFLNLEIDLANR
jgi:hypothetical protein